jgi:TolB-like protein/DNA-binding winged helix-turn-helix (wHTH) protein/tetratricopeptide (TPR) repeat protein
MVVVSHDVLLFDRFTLDLKRGSLHSADDEIALRPKTFELLRYLVENAGRLLPKDELHRALWPNVFVTDDSLVQCVGELRHALKDFDHRLIKTVPRRGYLLDTCLVSTTSGENSVGGGAASKEGKKLQKQGNSLHAAVAILILTAAAGAIAYSVPRHQMESVTTAATLAVPSRSLAVLPFQNLTGDPQQDYFVDGVTDDLTASLSRLPGFIVIARNTAFTYKDKRIDARRVGQELAVRYLIEGTIRVPDGQVQVNAQLVDASSGAVIWTERFMTGRAGLSELADDVTTLLARTFSIELVEAASAYSTRSDSGNADAADFLMRGRAAWNRLPKGGDPSESRQLFRKALELDDTLADAWAGLAQTYLTNVRFSQTREIDLLHAGEASERAVALRPDLASARRSRAATYYESGKVDEALVELELAARLDPNDVVIQSRIAAANVMLGYPERALAPLQRAMRCSPKDRDLATWQMFMGVAYLHLGEDKRAIGWLRKSIAINPRDPFTRLFLASALALTGRKAEAQDHITELLRQRPGMTIARWRALEPSNTPAFLAQRGRVYEGLRLAGLPDQG